MKESNEWNLLTILALVLSFISMVTIFTNTTTAYKSILALIAFIYNAYATLCFNLKAEKARMREEQA